MDFIHLGPMACPCTDGPRVSRNGLRLNLRSSAELPRFRSFVLIAGPGRRPTLEKSLQRCPKKRPSGAFLWLSFKSACTWAPWPSAPTDREWAETGAQTEVAPQSFPSSELCFHRWANKNNFGKDPPTAPKKGRRGAFLSDFCFSMFTTCLPNRCKHHRGPTRCYMLCTPTCGTTGSRQTVHL